MDKEQKDMLVGLPVSIPEYGYFVRGEVRKLCQRWLTAKEFDGMAIVTLPDGNEHVTPIRLTLLVYSLQKEPVGAWKERLTTALRTGGLGESRPLSGTLIKHGDEYIKLVIR